MEHDWLIYAGENEGNPLLVMLDKRWGMEYSDPRRPWAVMVELRVTRTDTNALPLQEEWPVLEALEAALEAELAAEEEDWRYVVRVYGEGVVRFGFYANRSGGADRRVGRIMAEFEGLGECKTVVLSDPKWSAYKSFFPEDQQKADEGLAPSFRDETPPLSSPDSPPTSSRYGDRSGRGYVREEQPWRGDELQNHPEDP